MNEKDAELVAQILDDYYIERLSGKEPNLEEYLLQYDLKRELRDTILGHLEDEEWLRDKMKSVELRPLPNRIVRDAAIRLYTRIHQTKRERTYTEPVVEATSAEEEIHIDIEKGEILIVSDVKHHDGIANLLKNLGYIVTIDEYDDTEMSLTIFGAQAGGCDAVIVSAASWHNLRKYIGGYEGIIDISAEVMVIDFSKDMAFGKSTANRLREFYKDEQDRKSVV